MIRCLSVAAAGFEERQNQMKMDAFKKKLEELKSRNEVDFKYVLKPVCYETTLFIENRNVDEQQEWVGVELIRDWLNFELCILNVSGLCSFDARAG